MLETEVSPDIATEVPPSPVPAEPVVEADVVAAPEEELTPEQLQAELAELREAKAQHETELKAVKEAESKKWETHFQSIADRDIATARKQGQEQVRRDNAFAQLQYLAQQADQGDTEAADQFRKAMADPGLVDVWNAGMRAKLPANVQQEVFKGQEAILNQVQATLEQHPEFRKLGRETMMKVVADSPGAPEYVANLAAALADHLANEKADAIVKEKLADHEKAVTSKVLTQEHEKAGDVANLRGGGPGMTETQIRKAYNEGDMDTPTYESRIRALGKSP